MTLPEEGNIQRQDEELPQDEDLAECVVCHRLCDPDEMNLPDKGLMCESCFDASYPG